MSNQLSESELQEIVQRIVQRTIRNKENIPSSAPAITPASLQKDSANADLGQVNKTRRIALAADHGGYSLKEDLKPYLQKQGYLVDDCGTHSPESVDY